MSTTTKPINLNDMYFKHQKLKPICVNLTYKDLQNLYQRAKANAQSVPSQL